MGLSTELVDVGLDALVIGPRVEAHGGLESLESAQAMAELAASCSVCSCCIVCCCCCPD